VANIECTGNGRACFRDVGERITITTGIPTRTHPQLLQESRPEPDPTPFTTHHRYELGKMMEA